MELDSGPLAPNLCMHLSEHLGVRGSRVSCSDGISLHILKLIVEVLSQLYEISIKYSITIKLRFTVCHYQPGIKPRTIFSMVTIFLGLNYLFQLFLASPIITSA